MISIFIESNNNDFKNLIIDIVRQRDCGLPIWMYHFCKKKELCMNQLLKLVNLKKGPFRVNNIQRCIFRKCLFGKIINQKATLTKKAVYVFPPSVPNYDWDSIAATVSVFRPLG